jgi:flagellar biosynthesis protein FlhG
VQAAQQAIVVVCDEPASITDAYALIKVFSRDYGISHFQIVSNQTRSPREGRLLFDKLRKVTDLYLDVVLRHFGNVPQDEMLRRAVQEQRAVVEAYPKSPSAQSFARMAETVAGMPSARKAGGNIEFFFEHLLTADRPSAGRVA